MLASRIEGTQWGGMLVHRVIYRWDFDFSVEILDRPGAVMKALKHSDAARWQNVKDNQPKRTVALSYLSPSEETLRTIEFAPTHAVFSIEWAKGIPVKRLDSNSELADLFQHMDSIKEVAKLRRISRSGIRFFYLSAVGQSSPTLPLEEVVPVEGSAQQAQTAVIPSPLLGQFMRASFGPIAEVVAQRAGKINDAMAVFEGMADDRLSYSVRTGPYAMNERGKFFEKVKPDLADMDFICDADFYESSFELAVSAKSWCRPIFTRFVALTADLEASIRGAK